jgi:hypothetical protein
VTTYLVKGPGRYLGTEPGSILVAALDEGMEERAIRRGSIEIVDGRPCSIKQTLCGLPRGWKITPMKGD